MAIKKEFEDVEFHGVVSFFKGLTIRIGTMIIKALTVVGVVNITGDVTIAGNLTLSGTTNDIKKYVAKITQSTTEAPVATVWVNDLGGTVVWARGGAGSYTATLVGAFADSLMAVAVQDFYATGNVANGFRQNLTKSSDDALILKQYNDALVPSDTFTMYVEVTLYPA